MRKRENIVYYGYSKKEENKNPQKKLDEYKEVKNARHSK